jgi:hypothetical protein
MQSLRTQLLRVSRNSFFKEILVCIHLSIEWKDKVQPSQHQGYSLVAKQVTHSIVDLAKVSPYVVLGIIRARNPMTVKDCRSRTIRGSSRASMPLKASLRIVPFEGLSKALRHVFQINLGHTVPRAL